jgi:uroporphyrinogen decarboxylase
MSPKERWLAVLNRRTPDRLPMDYQATDEMTAKLLAYLGCPDRWTLFEKLDIDKLFSVEPAYIGPTLDPGFDIYGCRFEAIQYNGGFYSECVFHPLASYTCIDEIEANYIWPSPDWFDYSVIPDQVKGKERYPVRGGGSEPFLTYKDLRGMEQAYIDLIENPEMVHYCLSRLFDFCYENTTRIFEQLPGKIDLAYVAEDFGSQENLLISRHSIREFFLPEMERMINLVHQNDAFVIFHSDGAIREIIPDMIGIGIDILNPVQWRCKGMDRKALKCNFGDHLIFYGGVDNQYTLAFGDVNDVKEEVKQNIQVLGQDGGYILAPCHNIQVVSPPENIVAMYEAGIEYGRM